MDKAELSKLLSEKVQEKLNEGYSIPTYALDAASRDRVKRELQPHGHTIPAENRETEEWQDYLQQVETGTYKPASRKPLLDTPQPTSTPATDQYASSGSARLWKARRH